MSLKQIMAGAALGATSLISSVSIAGDLPHVEFQGVTTLDICPQLVFDFSRAEHQGNDVTGTCYLPHLNAQTAAYGISSISLTCNRTGCNYIR